MNWNANYPELKTEIRPGNFTEGVVPFAAIQQKDFTIYVNGSSENWDETINEMAFSIHVE